MRWRIASAPSRNGWPLRVACIFAGRTRADCRPPVLDSPRKKVSHAELPVELHLIQINR
jgi:hypothetical protein